MFKSHSEQFNVVAAIKQIRAGISVEVELEELTPKVESNATHNLPLTPKFQLGISRLKTLNHITPPSTTYTRTKLKDIGTKRIKVFKETKQEPIPDEALPFNTTTCRPMKINESTKNTPPSTPHRRTEPKKIGTKRTKVFKETKEEPIPDKALPFNATSCRPMKIDVSIVARYFTNMVALHHTNDPVVLSSGGILDNFNEEYWAQKFKIGFLDLLKVWTRRPNSVESNIAKLVHVYCGQISKSFSGLCVKKKVVLALLLKYIKRPIFQYGYDINDILEMIKVGFYRTCKNGRQPPVILQNNVTSPGVIHMQQIISGPNCTPSTVAFIVNSTTPTISTVVKKSSTTSTTTFSCDQRGIVTTKVKKKVAFNETPIILGEIPTVQVAQRQVTTSNILGSSIFT